MLAQAAGFALLAAVSPTALLVMAVFLGSDNPRRIALMYVAGAVVMTVVMAVVVLLILRAAHFNDSRHHEHRYALRFALGLLALLAGAFLVLRRRRRRSADRAPAARKDKKPGLVSRMTARPRPRTAFITGLLLFAPSTAFIAAVQVVATANAGIPVTVAAIVIVVVLTVATVWLPLVTYLAAPEATTRALRSANAWIKANSGRLVVAALAVCGVALTVNGALGLWG